MKKTVSVARALKEKNRIAGRLARLRDLVNRENSREKKVPRGIDVRGVYDESRTLRDRLVAVKSAIAFANQPIVGKIIELDEVKSEISYMNGLNVREGVFEKGDYGRSVTEAYDAVIRKPEVLARIAELQDRADELQDALDEFNASTASMGAAPMEAKRHTAQSRFATGPCQQSNRRWHVPTTPPQERHRAPREPRQEWRRFKLAT